MNTALYEVTIELKNGAKWVEEIWAEHMQRAAVRAFAECKAAGQKPIRVVSTEVLARG